MILVDSRNGHNQEGRNETRASSVQQSPLWHTVLCHRKR